LTYRELFELTGAVRAFLAEEGIKRSERVALLLRNSPEYIAVYYGILAAGGVVVALNTQAKARDITNWIRHAEAKWLFSDHDHPELVQISRVAKDVKIIAVGTGRELSQGYISWEKVLEARSASPAASLVANDLASIIYTSGTTGEPKGVTLTHGNFSSNIDAILEYLKLAPGDSIVNVLPFYYSYGNSVLHTHLSSGGLLILENNLVYPHKVVQRIADEKATGFSGVPSTFALLLSRVNLSEYDLSNLRYITQAGGPMAPSLAEQLLRELPDTRLFVMYGQTEATARLSYLPPEKMPEAKGSVGVPIPGVTIQIRDRAGKLVSKGVTGEIYARGKNIMQGYWRDPAKTAEVLTDGWLHTGDLGHFDDKGYLYIDGRSSDMIKAGANRISPKEIEEVIQELEQIQEVAVIGVPDRLLGEVIKAYIVCRPGQALDRKKVQLHCKKNLAIYKIPKIIEFIDELPKTSSGKVKRYKLMSNHLTAHGLPKKEQSQNGET